MYFQIELAEISLRSSSVWTIKTDGTKVSHFPSHRSRKRLSYRGTNSLLSLEKRSTHLSLWIVLQFTGWSGPGGWKSWLMTPSCRPPPPSILVPSHCSKTAVWSAAYHWGACHPFHWQHDYTTDCYSTYHPRGWCHAMYFGFLLLLLPLEIDQPNTRVCNINTFYKCACSPG